MPTSVRESPAPGIPMRVADSAPEVPRFAIRLPVLLSVIAGMVDLTGFYTLGDIFTAHITGNLVVAAALVVRGGPVHLAQLLAIPVFMLALAVVWSIARVSGRRGVPLARLLLLMQFVLLAAVLIFCIITKPSTNPHGATAGVAVMLAVSAMAVQYALLRLAMPGAISTAVMTGNLTNAVLSLMDSLPKRDPLMTADRDKLKRSVQLLLGFLIGCVIAAAAVSLLADWAWLLPAGLAAVAVVLRIDM